MPDAARRAADVESDEPEECRQGRDGSNHLDVIVA